MDFEYKNKEKIVTLIIYSTVKTILKTRLKLYYTDGYLS